MTRNKETVCCLRRFRVEIAFYTRIMFHIFSCTNIRIVYQVLLFKYAPSYFCLIIWHKIQMYA